MIQVDFDQSDLNGAPKDVLESLGDGIVYVALARLNRIPGAGASGSATLQLDWTDAHGEARSMQLGALVAVPGDGESTRILTMQHPSTMTATLTGSTSGLYDLELSVHVARLREEGCS